MADQDYTTIVGGVTIADVKAPVTPMSLPDQVKLIVQQQLAIPQPAKAAPPGVANAGASGSSPRYALEDHTHASRVQRGKITTGSDGKASWVFPKPFGMEPITAYMVQKDVSDVGGPVSVEVIGFTVVTASDGTKTWTGLTVQAMRATKALPSMTPVTLLTGVIAALSGFVLQQPATAGLTINISAGEPTPN